MLKPHIRKIGGKWVCGLANSDRMQAATPEFAYKGWMFVYGKKLQDPKLAETFVALDSRKQTPKWAHKAINKILN